MTRYVALLRAVNVGGTGKLPMTDLVVMCEAVGFGNVRTYIASGNVVFDSEEDEAAVKQTLERELAAYAGKSVGVLMRTGAEMAAVLAANPFKDTPPNRTVCVFLAAPPPPDWMARATGQQAEVFGAVGREIFIHYPAGQADTKLKIFALAAGTGRNMNTVAKLAEMASGEMKK